MLPVHIFFSIKNIIHLAVVIFFGKKIKYQTKIFFQKCVVTTVLNRSNLLERDSTVQLYGTITVFIF